MTTTAPPTYDAAMADVKKIQAALTPDAQKKAEDAMAAELAKPEINKKLVDEVRALGDATIKVNESFVRVSADLASVDNNNYKDKNGQPIPKLKPTWDGFYEKFKYILWGSRDIATDTATYILDFYETYLPAIEDAIGMMETASASERASLLAELQPDFDSFLKKKNPATVLSNRPTPAGADPLTVSQVQSQDFLDLKNKIVAFQATFKDFADDTSVELKAKIKSLEDKITRLTLEIEGYDTIVKAMGIAMGVTGAAAGAGAVAAFFAFGPVGPAVALGVIIVGAIAMVAELGTLIAYLVKKSDAQSELDQAKRDKTDLEAQLAVLQALKKKLEDQSTDITYICGRLDQFANIWSLVASDAREANTQLQNAADAKSYSFLKKRVALLKTSYSVLYVGLKEYATKVSGSGVPKAA